MDNEVSLILSDVLMPALNGFQLCSNIKIEYSDLSYSDRAAYGSFR